MTNLGASFSLPKQWVNGEVLTHTDLNTQFNTILDNVAVASGIASLDGSTLVVQDPANATATKAAGKICKWGNSEAFQCSALTATTGAFSGVVTSTVATGTAPFTVSSTTEVTNLKAATATTATNLAITGEASAESGAVTVASTATEIVELNLGTVTSGDRIFAQAIVTLTKGGTGGSTSVYIEKKSGDATIATYHDESVLIHIKDVLANAGATFMPSGVIKVTGSGTLVIRLSGQSALSDSSVGSGAGDIYAFFLKKQ